MQSGAVGTLFCEVHKLLLEWAHPLSQNLLTLWHLPNIWYSTLQISGFFAHGARLLWMEEELGKETCIDHVSCVWSLCFGNLQFFRSWWVLSGVFSDPFCYTCGFFYFNKLTPIENYLTPLPSFSLPFHLFAVPFPFFVHLCSGSADCVLLCLPSRAFNFVE